MKKERLATKAGKDWHVVPLNDWIDHTYTDCVCIPNIETPEVADGIAHAVIQVHSSLDGRELTEDLEKEN